MRPADTLRPRAGQHGVVLRPRVGPAVVGAAVKQTFVSDKPMVPVAVPSDVLHVGEPPKEVNNNAPPTVGTWQRRYARLPPLLPRPPA